MHAANGEDKYWKNKAAWEIKNANGLDWSHPEKCSNTETIVEESIGKREHWNTRPCLSR